MDSILLIAAIVVLSIITIGIVVVVRDFIVLRDLNRAEAEYDRAHQSLLRAQRDSRAIDLYAKTVEYVKALDHLKDVLDKSIKK